MNSLSFSWRNFEIFWHFNFFCEFSKCLKWCLQTRVASQDPSQMVRTLWTKFGLFRSFLAKFRSDFFISRYSQYILNTLSRYYHDTLRNYTLRILSLYSQYILKVLSWYSQELCSHDIHLTFWVYSQVLFKFPIVILQHFWTYKN